MAQFVLLLRGVNVGGKALVPMARLREVLTDAGYDDVETYVQSGNVVAGSTARNADTVARAVERVLAEEFGREIAVVVRTAAAFRKVLDANPFADRLADGAPGTAVHVAFLRAKPSASGLAKVDAERFAPEEFRAVGKEVYLYLPNGIGRSKLAVELSERRLESAATVRNWNTVTKLAAMLATGS
jgi:uncharacterized protein (DUF1697 family)